MTMKDAPQTAEQEGKEFIVDDKLVEHISGVFLGSYRDITEKFVLSPGERLEVLAGIEADVARSVETILALKYRAGVRQLLKTDVEKHLTDLTEKLDQPEAVKNHAAYFRGVKDSQKNREEAPLPANFNDWCRATVDKIMIIIKRETDQNVG